MIRDLFKQNMFLRIKILNANRKLPVVPKTALLYKDGKFEVYMKVGGGDSVEGDQAGD